MTIIKAKKNLFDNDGKCFTKNKEYIVKFDRPINTEASLMEAMVTNDFGEPHIIGNYWRDFIIVSK